MFRLIPHSFLGALITMLLLLFVGCLQENVAPEEKSDNPCSISISSAGTSLITADNIVPISVQFKSTQVVSSIEIYNNNNLLYHFDQAEINLTDTIKTFGWLIPDSIFGEQKLEARIKTALGHEAKSDKIVLTVATGNIQVSTDLLEFDKTMTSMYNIRSFDVEWNNLDTSSYIKISMSGMTEFAISEQANGKYGFVISVPAKKNKTRIYIKFSPKINAVYDGSVFISHSQAVKQKVVLSAEGISPEFSLSIKPKVVFFPITFPNSQSQPVSIDVASTGISYGVNINSGDGFLISNSENGEYKTSLRIPYTGGNATAFKLYIKFAPKNSMKYSGVINVTDGYASEYVSATGMTVIPSHEMVLVPGDIFAMGSESLVYYNASKPVHQVTLDSFYIDRYEVMQADWQKLMGNNPSSIKNNYNPVESVNWYEAIVYCNKLSISEKRTPVYSIKGSTNPVDWGEIPDTMDPVWDAVVCNFSAKGYRLPTEAEWEFASRGGKLSRMYNFSGSNSFYDVAWFGPNSKSTTRSCGYLNPNEISIYDMSGNVNEWVWDWWNDYSEDPQINPTGSETGKSRMFRGGSFLLAPSQIFCRFNRNPNIKNDDVGFRVVRSK